LPITGYQLKPGPCKSNRKDKVEEFEHSTTLQLYDAYGVPVPNTSFIVKLLIRKEDNFITIQLPAINFQTGPLSGNPIEEPYLPPIINGGYLYTSDGFLPCELRPNDIITRSFFAPSNNGANLAFSYTDTPAQLPTPIAGYLLQITNAGGLVIQGVGTLGNIIPPGQQNVLPTTLSYLVKPELKVKKNTAISSPFTNTTKFAGPNSAFYLNIGLRDTTFFDAFDGIVVMAWPAVMGNALRWWMK
jgi:hypothetical protein